MPVLTYRNNRFEFIGGFEDRHEPKKAGFEGFERGVWFTASPARAASLAKYADIEAELELLMAEATKRASRSQVGAMSVPCPEGLRYRPYQLAGIEFMLSRPGVLQGDDMGLGKTIQVAGVINADPSIQSVLIVVPAFLKINWERELERWLTRSIVNLMILSYEKIEDGLGSEWDLAVLDEAHYISNPTAKRSEAAGKIQAKRRIAMTGTPIPNRLKTVHNIWAWCDPAGAPPRKQFLERYCELTQKVILTTRLPKRIFKAFATYCTFSGERVSRMTTGKLWFGFLKASGEKVERWAYRVIDDDNGHAHEAELQDRLRSSVMIRRRKQDVLDDLPPKMRMVVTLTPSGKAAKVIKKERDLCKVNGWDAIEVEKLREPGVPAFEQVSLVRHEVAKAKIEPVGRYVCTKFEGSPEKVILFAHHYDVLDGLADALKCLNPVRVDGRLSNHKRMAAVDTFQSDPNCRCLIGQIKAAGVGLNLTAGAYVLFAELDWTDMSQAEDRAWRIGQSREVTVQYLVFENTLDARMARMLVHKDAVAEAALDKEPEA